MLLGVIKTFHQVFVRSTAPITVNGVGELLPRASRTMEVDHDDHVSIRREQFGIPAIRPVISPRSLRAAVDEEFHRIFFRSFEVRRLNQSTFHPVAVRTGE